jgi:hypothetical protein
MQEIQTQMERKFSMKQVKMRGMIVEVLYITRERNEKGRETKD